MDISKKDLAKYRDIEWLMPSIDPVLCLDRLGVKHEGISGEEIKGFCPDHYLFVGRESSDPNWFLNIKTGATICFTEGRGSNLVYTAKRLKGFSSPRETVEWLTGKTEESLNLSAISFKLNSLSSTPKDKPHVDVQLDDVRAEILTRPISQRVYDFFMYPVGKKPTYILPATVDRFNVFERTWGYYRDRAIVPFLLDGDLVGFAAIDLLGKKKWLEENPMKEEKSYRKVLYPDNFKSAQFIFGYDESKGCDDLIITEGPREVMKLQQEGFASVAVLKAHLSDAQMVLVGKLSPKRIYLMFDGNDAGYEANRKCSNTLQYIDKEKTGAFYGQVFGCFLPVGVDPKNMSKNEIKMALEKAKKME